MSKRKPSGRQQEKDESGLSSRVQIFVFVFDRIYQVAMKAIPWAGVILLVYFGVYLPIQASVGQETKIEHFVHIIADWGLDKIAPWVLGGGGAIYGLRERKLRKDTVARMEARIRELETTKDSDRTSSNLTNRGDTPPETNL